MRTPIVRLLMALTVPLALAHSAPPGMMRAPAARSPILGASSTGHDASTTDWTLAGQLGGEVTDVAWLGDYAILGFGPRVVVIDVAIPERPRWLATSPLLPDIAWSLAVAGDRVYVAAGDSGLIALDARDPLNLQVAASLDMPGAALDVQVAGDYAYVAVGDVGLRVVDVRDPARLVEVGVLELPGGETPDAGWRVAVGGGKAVVVTVQGPATIVDVADPRRPVRIGIADAGGDAVDVAIAGDRAWVAHWGNRLTMIDLADPARSATTEVAAAATQFRSLAAEGALVYAGDDRGAVHVVDVSDPAHPRALGEVGQVGVDQPVVVTALAARSGLVLGPISMNLDARTGRPARWYGGALRLVDARQPSQPRVAAILRMPFGVLRDIDVAADGRSVWVVDAIPDHNWFDAMPDFARGAALLVDAADPARPRVRASLPLPAAVHAIALAALGSHVYVLGMLPESESTLDVYVFDVADLDAPRFEGAVGFAGGMGLLPNPFYPADILVHGDRLLVSESDRVYVSDLSDPAAPRVLASYDQSALNYLMPTVDMAVAAPYVYFGTEEGIAVMDLRDPLEPYLAAFTRSDFYTGIAAIDRMLLWVGQDNFMHVVDASTLSGLREVGRVAIPASPYTSITAFGAQAFTLGLDGTLGVFDIAAPASPALRQTVSMSPPEGWDSLSAAPVVAARSGRVYASAIGSGLVIYSSISGGEPPQSRVYLPIAQPSLASPSAPLLRKLELRARLAPADKPIQVHELAADERYAYLAMGKDCQGSLGIVDASRPAAPVLAGSIDLPFTPIAVRLAAGRVYVAGVACSPVGSGALAIIDVARADRPRLVGQLSLPYALFDLSVNGRWVYVMEVLEKNPWPNQDLPVHPGRPSLRTIDVADPSAPRELGLFQFERWVKVTGSAAIDGFVLLTDFAVGLRVLDMTDPFAPRELAGLPIHQAFDVVVEGRRAFVVSTSDEELMLPGGLWAVDISDPAHPREIGALANIHLLGGVNFLDAMRVAVSDGIAYSSSDSGLLAFDAHDPTSPRLLDRSLADTSPMGVAAVGRRAYTVDPEGLTIYELVNRVDR